MADSIEFVRNNLISATGFEKGKVYWLKVKSDTLDKEQWAEMGKRIVEMFHNHGVNVIICPSTADIDIEVCKIEEQ